MRLPVALLLLVLVLVALGLAFIARDSDGDGIPDYLEVSRYRTDPNNPDSDGDGISDYLEVFVYRTDPNSPDSDGDGISDYLEVYKYRTDPNAPDLALGYALGRLPEGVALLFKNVSYDEDFKELVELASRLPRERLNSSDVVSFLSGVVRDGKVDALERNLFDDRFVNPTLPEVNVTWEPVRVNLDKIYDVRIRVQVRDDKTPIANVTLRFIPVEYRYMVSLYGMREEDYPKVFPPDRERVFNLPTRGGLSEEYSVEVRDIVGGREYLIRVEARDLAGNQRVLEVKTPYIRQFENIGKLLYEKGVIVSAVYVAWDFMYIPMKDSTSMPLLGRYRSDDDIVQWKHIDWATGHGINVFYIDGGFWESWKTVEHNVLKGFLRKDMKFAFLWGWNWQGVFKTGGEGIPGWGVDLSDKDNFNKFIVLFRNILRPEVLNHPNYHKVDGRPVIFIWGEGALFNQYDAHRKAREMVKEAVGREPYIIGDNLPRIPILPHDDYFKRRGGDALLDAFSPWIGYHKVGLDTREFVDNYVYYYRLMAGSWLEYTVKKGKNYVGSITPGFDHSYSWGPPQIPLPRDPNRFREVLRIALENLDPRHRELRIDTWNDFGEWSYVEPSRGDGFTFLEILRESLLELLGSKP